MRNIIFPLIFSSLIILSLSANCYSSEYNNVKKYQDKLYENDFKGLEGYISNVEKRYLESKSLKNESDLTFVYRIFQLERLDAEEHLDKWVDYSPKSHIPYLARGIYKYNRAWLARGTKYINETTKEQIDGLKYFLLDAKKDFETASKLEGNIYIPYLYLMDSAKTGVLEGSVDEYYESGLKYASNSYTLHLWYALNIRPRWGGSEEQWEKLLGTIEPKLSVAPHLQVVYAVINSMYSSEAKRQGDMDLALKLIDESIALGPAADFYYDKFLILNELKRTEEAKLALLNAENIKPERARYLTELAVLYYSEHDWKACVDFSSRAIYRGNETIRTYTTRGICQERIGLLNEALLDYKKAIKIEPKHQWTHSAIARINTKLAADKVTKTAVSGRE